jgi:hypothetical protein
MNRTPLLALALAVAGCQEPQRADYISAECDSGQPCSQLPPKGSGSGGSGAQPGDAAADGPTTTVSGRVALVTQSDFTTAIPFTDPAIVELEDAAGTPIEASYDGSSFTLHGVRSASSVWATVRPTTAGNDALATLQPLDTTSPGPVELLVVSSSVLELVYGLLASPTLPSFGDAQIVLHFRDASTLAPVPNVVVSHPMAETVAYDVAGSYSNAVDATGPLGIALVINVPALAQSSIQKLQITTPSGAASLELPLLGDAVTLADVLLSP